MALGGMTGYVRVLLHNLKTKGLICSTKQSNCWTCRVGAKRYLLPEDIIRLHDFQQRKLAVAHQLYGEKEKYFEMFNQKLQRNELILKDELKVLLHLCQTPEDMETAKSAIYRYHEENRNVAFGEFKFGPLFMRLCYELGLEELAADTVKDKPLKGFFSDSTSFNIAMDMLFTKGYYDSAMEVLIDMKNQGVPFNKDTLMLAFGICYKLNTPNSYKICTTLLEEAQTKGRLIPRHAYCFAVALALKQEDVEKAKSIYSQIMSTDGRICQNLKVLILAKEGAIKDVLSVLTSTVMPNSPEFVKKPEFSQEVVDAVRSRTEDDAVLHGRVERVLAKLQQSGQVTALSLDDMLCHTPTGKRRPAGVLLEQRKTSRRTFRPLQSTLLSE
ncbi:hypothetical protein MATL_G00088780 [Megalops atlanticus]|uniref:Pentatricopeptide repeat-containing protein 2, mitochondrial n=1 Tax=Megalops atlanticus TaxID=7932 RepID=A0A9D3Q7V0_MEGAT|nr:hypothetical protein MATL_G00088780 [Megalops atlanticus]